jgi:hypothetical protein
MPSAEFSLWIFNYENKEYKKITTFKRFRRFFYSKVEGKVPKSTIEDIITLITLFEEQPQKIILLTTALLCNLLIFLVIKGIVQRIATFAK